MKKRRIQVAAMIALVLALHLAVLWPLLGTSHVRIVRADSQGLQIVFIPPPPATPEISGSSQRASPQARAVARHGAAQRSSISYPAVAPPDKQSNAIQAPIDWAAELTDAAKAATADQPAQAPRDFGFPKIPAAPRKTPQLEWDYAATHRVEGIEGGGLLVHLNDRCVLVLFPLPFVGCGIGTKAANGQLLEHMGDPKEPDPGPVP